MRDWRKYAEEHAEYRRIDENGNTIYNLGYFEGKRYRFDFNYCKSADGWKQYDTIHDAWYFGVWVHLEQRLVVTFAEGELSLVVCPDDEHLKVQIKSMNEFYGDPPPAFIVIDDDGKRTDIYDSRPEVKV